MNNGTKEYVTEHTAKRVPVNIVLKNGEGERRLRVVHVTSHVPMNEAEK